MDKNAYRDEATDFSFFCEIPLIRSANAWTYLIYFSLYPYAQYYTRVEHLAVNRDHAPTPDACISH